LGFVLKNDYSKVKGAVAVVIELVVVKEYIETLSDSRYRYNVLGFTREI
jgi:hypothetical protein